MTDLIEQLSHDDELIAQAMLMTRGDLAKASRLDSIPINAMALRSRVSSCPGIRTRYHELLAQEMQEKGLHIAERILKMAELQERAFGGEFEYVDDDGEVRTQFVPSDPKMVIELSKEISRLIAEGKGTNISAKTAILLASKEDAKEILENFLN